jgi:hypothetical protein
MPDGRCDHDQLRIFGAAADRILDSANVRNFGEAQGPRGDSRKLISETLGLHQRRLYVPDAFTVLKE